ncbi:hypothetical protein [Shinella sp.]|uniref:hypothetical protein n=1 Tax=Shinella sp. TaxID=1870904 RepID=UPI003F71C34C
MKRDDNVTLKDIEEGMQIFARLADRYGDCMLPHLERLEREHEARRQKRNASSQVKRIAALIASGDTVPPAKPSTTARGGATMAP